MTTQEFEQKALDAVFSTLLKRIDHGQWINYPIGSHATSVSREWLEGLFAKIDWKRVEERVLNRVEDRIADKIFNSLATEVSGDAKTLMCDQKAREAFRELIRERIAVVAK